MITLSESRLHNIIIESINNLLLTESQESKSISAAKKLVMQRLGYDEQQADKFVRMDLRQDLPSLRTPEGGKFILGVTRMFCDGELRDANTIGRLNTTLKYVASDAHINEYDRNLNGMSAQDLIDRFAKNVEMDLENDRNEVDAMNLDGNSEYDIVRINSHEQASEYGKYTSWCVTHDDYMFDSYTNDGFNQFYFCLKKGFEQVPQEQGEGCPLDEYGLSMIAVCVNEKGRLETCTCRWNHDNGGNDNIMDTKEISNVIGMRFYDVFKPNTMWKDMLDNAMQRLANGEDPEEVFDIYDDDIGFGLTLVALGKKENYLKSNGDFLFPGQWFDNCGLFKNGFAIVNVNRKYNFINQNGEILYGDIKHINQWFDYCQKFRNGYSMVGVGRRYNFINQNGEILYKPNEPDQWFDHCCDLKDGIAVVYLNEKWNFMNLNGEIIRPNQWFDKCSDFKNGFGRVKLNDKYNYVNQNGQLLTELPTADESIRGKWFDFCYDFHESGKAEVIGFDDNASYIINKYGNILG